MVTNNTQAENDMKACFLKWEQNRQMEGGQERRGEGRGWASISGVFNYSMTRALIPERNKQTGLWQWTNHVDTNTYVLETTAKHTHGIESPRTWGDVSMSETKACHPNTHLKNHLLPKREQWNLSQKVCKMILLTQQGGACSLSMTV